ncbi:hypothetical protein NST20_11350 [Weizmannia sp. FSL W8-0676]|uniref:hypothetical protein n=1 Tax=Weizmannia sp. FSL W8-0676 TaxID=2954703 RepID=UPI0031586915
MYPHAHYPARSPFFAGPLLGGFLGGLLGGALVRPRPYFPYPPVPYPPVPYGGYPAFPYY